MDIRMPFCTWHSRFHICSVVDPIPYFTKQSPLVYYLYLYHIIQGNWTVYPFYIIDFCTYIIYVLLLLELNGLNETIGDKKNLHWSAYSQSAKLYSAHLFIHWRASETLSGVTQLKIGDICYRASKASEILLGVVNAKSGIRYIYMCVYMDSTYAP